ncbi:MAG: IclR family transcriptional regulator [Armatimonadota bacterium]|nr:IclR family transcriptional regulator [Armatimonadota bacterium]MDR7533254.1 IclR family transcriptional regulator [Armatimonadota bacterium]MDR7536953.1 IclR family transcriptional regulator [Armatimonadota bacterium]
MPRPRRGAETSRLKTVERALSLLWLFDDGRRAVGLPEVAALLRLPRSTAHRLLASLEGGGLLVYDRRAREYRLSLRLARLGDIARRSVDLRAVARGYLARLARETGESAFLLVAQDASAIVIDVEESGHPLKLTLPVGRPWPLHAGASNRAMLAYLPPEQVAAYLARPLEQVTSHTLTDPAALAAELEATRRRGYAYSVGELTPDVAGVGVPILADGLLIGGLSVAGPASRLGPERVGAVVAALQVAAAGIARAIAGDRPWDAAVAAASAAPAVRS